MKMFTDGNKNKHYILKIMGLEFRVVDDLKEHDKWGYCNFVDQVIQIRRDYPPGKRTEVLLHEIFHAILTALPPEEIREKPMDEETIVTFLARGLTAVLRDNPKFFTDELLND